jgi:hypothetical protein
MLSRPLLSSVNCEVEQGREGMAPVGTATCVGFLLNGCAGPSPNGRIGHGDKRQLAANGSNGRAAPSPNRRIGEGENWPPDGKRFKRLRRTFSKTAHEGMGYLTDRKWFLIGRDTHEAERSKVKSPISGEKFM